MKTVSGIDYLGATFTSAQRCQTGNHRTHGRMAMNNVVLLGVDNLLQLAIGCHIIGAEREALKRDIKICIAIRDHTIPGIIKIVMRCDGSLPAHLLNHLQIRKMKSYDVASYHSLLQLQVIAA